MYKCKQCTKGFNTRQSYAGHISSHSRNENYRRKRQTDKSILRSRNSNKQNCKYCKYCNKVFENPKSLGGHTVLCINNPKRKETIEKIQKRKKGEKMSDDTKKKVSEGMKLAHKEKRAWNIGKSRWNNEPSYPERFFMKVIENEFEDKNYIREFPLGIYSLDFAWPKKKIAIEIDGEQHQRFEEYKLRDSKKDAFAEKEGWKILRVEFKYLFNNTKDCINMCKNFVNTNSILVMDDYISWKNLVNTKNELKHNAKLLEKEEKTKTILELIEKIKKSDIKFNEYGWVTKVSIIIGCKPQKVNIWMRKNMEDFYKKCFKRNY
jgi:very-short-patch-repair endonuclease